VLSHRPKTLPAPHERFLVRALEVLGADPRLAGVAAGGSFLSDEMDAFSDLDLVVVAFVPSYERVMEERQELAQKLGTVLAAFTGEHVGEPRLLICLYEEDEPLHVDLKFVSLADAAKRVEDPVILWERDGALSRAFAQGVAAYPQPDEQWLEDRFWVWVHYAATKIRRGELFEAVGILAYLRAQVLGPLALARAGLRPSGLRRVERLPADELAPLAATVAALSRADALRALRASVDLYRRLRARSDAVSVRAEAERAAVEYVAAS